MAVAMPSVERSFFFRVDGRLSLEALEGIGRLEVETPSLPEPEAGAAVGILDSPAALAAVLVFRGGISYLLSTSWVFVSSEHLLL